MLSKSNGKDREDQVAADVGEQQLDLPSAPASADKDVNVGSRADDAAEAKGPVPQHPEHVEKDLPPEKPEEAPAGNDSGDEPRSGFLRHHPIAIPVGGIVLALMIVAGYLYWDYSSHFQSTDDAFIAARQFAVAPKVSGYLTAVPVTDNQHLNAGDVIVRIDDRDYRVALAQAQAQVQTAQANVENIDAQITVQQAQTNANQAQVDQAQANLVFAQQQATRYGTLAQRGSGSVETAQQFVSQLHQQEAALKTAQSNLAVAQRQIESLHAQRSSMVGNLAQATAQRDQAELNLSYTTVTAAQPGRVTNLGAAVGQYVQAGTNLTMFVPDEIWVTANFKETQLAGMRPGQSVTMRVDAYPDRALSGHVDSIQSGSGPAFSLLPPENATGNYVKIVQRVPVKLVFDHPPPDVALGPGMSVVPTVRVDPAPSLIERLTARL